MPYTRKTSDLFVSEKMQKVLLQIEKESLVAKLLLGYNIETGSKIGMKNVETEHIFVPKEILVEENHINYISVSNTDPTKISYLTTDRIERIQKAGADIWNCSIRVHGKPGSFVGKLFKGIDAKEVELFSNLYKNIVTRVSYDMEVISGIDIKKWYNGNVYDYGGSLGASCMKYDACQDFFNLYINNAEIISMLIMKSPSGSLIGRALLWNIPKTDSSDAILFMDRIYTTSDEKYAFHFKKWADERGYFYKADQKWNDTLHFESKGEKFEKKLEFQLKNWDFRKYPYLDTMKFMDENGKLFNYIPNHNRFKTLCAPNGEKLSFDYLKMDTLTNLFHYPGEIVRVPYLGVEVFSGSTCYSEINETYILTDHCIYLDEINQYIFIEKFEEYNKREAIDKLIIQSKERARLRQEALSELANSKRNITSRATRASDRYYYESPYQSYFSDAGEMAAHMSSSFMVPDLDPQAQTE